MNAEPMGQQVNAPKKGKKRSTAPKFYTHIFLCPLCPRMISGSPALCRHVRKHHAFTHSCLHCKTLAPLAKLKINFVIAGAFTLHIFACPECDFQYGNFNKVRDVAGPDSLPNKAPIYLDDQNNSKGTARKRRWFEDTESEKRNREANGGMESGRQ